jgi:endoglucanase
MYRKILLIVLLSAGIMIARGQDFVQRQGRKVYHRGSELLLRGMAFGNLVWVDSYADTPEKHHSEADYQRVQDLGMNAIRFYMNYKTFEDDAKPYQYKQSGWDWIDRNIKWAKAHNIYLILNMHVPQGGFQSRCEGSALWADTSNQGRLIALWKAIASRYQNEPQIAGFDLLNEPTPSGSIGNWTNLAQRIINDIRSVDKNHMIITERALALGCDYGYTDENNNYPQINESNLMYTVHMYDPFEFTHQNLDFVNTGDGGSYPDNSKISVPGDAKYATGDYNNPSVPAGNSDWTHFEGSPFIMDTDTLLCGRVVFLSNKIAGGKVYFDDFELKELDENNNVTRIIHSVNLTSAIQWYWSSDNTGTNSSSESGHGDNFAVTITGNKANATIILPDFAFSVEKGKKYVVSGWMKGENVPSGASASISTEFYFSPAGKKLKTRNYDYLAENIAGYSAYIEQQGFPVYFGEFGAGRPCFENNKGGGRWVADCLRIFDSLGYHFTYHSYKEGSFGLYNGWDEPVDPASVNTELQDVFRSFAGITSQVKDPRNEDESFLRIHPNPVEDKLQITLSSGRVAEYITITDGSGRKVMETSGSEISIRNLKPGIYYLQIVSEDSATSQKFIKK